MPNDEIPACLTCAACCEFPRDEGGMRLTPAEASWIKVLWGPAAIHLGDPLGPRLDSVPGADGDPDRCSFLRDTEEGYLACAIYDQRPDACRNYQAGSPACRGRIEASKIEV
jgi:hypothetical protein